MRSSTAIWFDVYTKAANPESNPYGTFDIDGLSQYAETRTYGSDPFDSDSDDDAQMPNGNGINDRLEVLYGLDPTEKPDTAGGTEDYDPTSANTVDDDGINFGAEAQFGGRPDQQDIFVEVDWMSGHSLNDGAINLIMTQFAAQDIAIKIDNSNSCSGNCAPYLGEGGEVISNSKDLKGDVTNSDDFGYVERITGDNNDYLDFKWGNNWDADGDDDIDTNEISSIDGFFEYQRWGIFHYGLFIDRFEGVYIAGEGEKYGELKIEDDNLSDDFIVSEGVLDDIYMICRSLWYGNVVYSIMGIPFTIYNLYDALNGYSQNRAEAVAFIHEIGHNFGLGHSSSGSVMSDKLLLVIKNPYEYITYTDSEWITVKANLYNIDKAAPDQGYD